MRLRRAQRQQLLETQLSARVPYPFPIKEEPAQLPDVATGSRKIGRPPVRKTHPLARHPTSRWRHVPSQNPSTRPWAQQHYILAQPRQRHELSNLPHSPKESAGGMLWSDTIPSSNVRQTRWQGRRTRGTPSLWSSRGAQAAGRRLDVQRSGAVLPAVEPGSAVRRPRAHLIFKKKYTYTYIFV